MMPCNKIDCNQGRNCDCPRNNDVAVGAVVAVVLFIIMLVAISCLVFKLLNGNTGQDCAVEVQFKDSKATYIGQTV
jgi:hypothetical protein